MPKQQKPIIKRSENAAAVAKEVVEKVSKGEKVVMGKIMKKHGYSKHTSKQPDKVRETTSYKEIVDPVAAKMMDARVNILDELVRKGRIRTYKKEKLIFLSTTLKNLTHDIQLLTGGQTENTGIDKYIAELNSLAAKITAKKNAK
jgi:predicted metalloprotease